MSGAFWAVAGLVGLLVALRVLAELLYPENAGTAKEFAKALKPRLNKAIGWGIVLFLVFGLVKWAEEARRNKRAETQAVANAAEEVFHSLPSQRGYKWERVDLGDLVNNDRGFLTTLSYEWDGKEISPPLSLSGLAGGMVQVNYRYPQLDFKTVDYYHLEASTVPGRWEDIPPGSAVYNSDRTAGLTFRGTFTGPPQLRQAIPIELTVLPDPNERRQIVSTRYRGHDGSYVAQPFQKLNWADLPADRWFTLYVNLQTPEGGPLAKLPELVGLVSGNNREVAKLRWRMNAGPNPSVMVIHSERIADALHGGQPVHLLVVTPAACRVFITMVIDQ